MADCFTCPRQLTGVELDAGAHACTLCTAQMRDWLREIPRHTRVLPQFLQHAGRPSRGHLGASRGSAMPPRLDVLTLTGPGRAAPPEQNREDQAADGTPILAWLDGWATYVAAQHPAVSRDEHGTARVQPCEAAAVHADQAATVETWARWLLAYLPAITTQPWVASFHHDLQDRVYMLRGITGLTPRRVHRSAPCLRCSEWALVQADGADIRCEACGWEIPSDQFDAYAAAALTAHTPAA